MPTLFVPRSFRSVRSLPRSLGGGAALLLGLILWGLLSGGSAPLAAQDVELLGRIHGARPPAAYYEVRSRNPDAFELGRAWHRRTGLGLGGDRALDGPDGVDGADGAGDVQRAPAPAGVTGLGPREKPVSGTFAFPVLLGRFNDTEAIPYTRDDVQREFFDGPVTGGRRTIRDYYDEASHGHVDLVGHTYDWVTSTLDRSEVTGTSSGLGGDAEVGEFIRELLARLDGTGVDWARFDNDGPDGIPNSGDDDGYVDLLAVMHPTAGAECGGAGTATRVWSHRWQLSAATDSSASDPDPGAGDPWVSSFVSASPSTDYIRVDDYMIAPVLECDWEDSDAPGETDINQIGVLAHELGHGFGLPDLYGTGSSGHYGAGSWDLMGTGAWGCDGDDPSTPCLPGAWTKHAMGWVTVDTIPAGTSLGEVTLDPVETSGRIVLVESNDGSGEYFLLENRRREGFDQNLLEEGLLIWHVDPSVVNARWVGNQVNVDPAHPGVWLRQADGRNDLMRAGGGRGDPGDAFTPAAGSDQFHAGSDPASITHVGEASGVTVAGIREVGSLLSLDLESTYHTVSLQVGGSGSPEGEFRVDGESGYPPGSAQFGSAAFQSHEIRAPPGEPSAADPQRVRDGFRGWSDGPACPAREFITGLADSTLVASYGSTDVLFAVNAVGPQPEIDPGSVTFEPGCDGWVPQGVTVVVEAVARTGFEFLHWDGAFAGRDNPFTIDAGGPLEAEALFDLTYSVASNPNRIDLVAATDWEIVLQTSNENAPVTWSLLEGEMPPGLDLGSGGIVEGVPLEEGSYPLLLEARDAIGLTARLDLELVVEEPVLGLRPLAAPFVGGEDPPTPAEEAYLDWWGNRNAAYDVGDFRAYLQGHPDAPDTSPDPVPDAASGMVPGRSAADPTTIVVPPVRLEAEDDGPTGTAPEGPPPGGGS